MNKATPVVRTVERSRRFRWRGAVGAVVLTPAFLVTLFSTPLVVAGSWFDIVVNVLAWVSFVAGATMRFWATLFIGGRKDKVLMTDGPYSICRNPLYLGSFLLMVATGLFLKSLIFVIALLVVAIAYMLITVPVEEEYLRIRHGEEFNGYCACVPRIIPSLAGFQMPERLEVNTHTLWLECARASRWVWLPLIGLGVTYLRNQSWWPILFASP
jgi:protein-S-isoprenylcysteine O-methyltransferase Ste14